MTEPSPPLRYDLYPAGYHPPGADTTRHRDPDCVRDVRVFASADTVYVYADRSGPTLIAEHRYDRVVVADPSYEFTLDDGTTIFVHVRGGCGCGSTLRRWPGPWTPMRYGT